MNKAKPAIGPSIVLPRLSPTASSLPPHPYPDTATDWIPATCIAQRTLATWLGDPDLSAWMEKARLNAARGIGDHHADPRMKSALTRMFANWEPALAKLETFQATPGSRAAYRPRQNRAFALFVRDR